MGTSKKKIRLTPEEYFSAADFEWLSKVADYERDDPERFVFADDGDCAEICSLYAMEVLEGNPYGFIDVARSGCGDDMTYADEPDFGRTFVLCMRYCIDVWENVDAMRWLGFMYQIGRFVEHDAYEAARLYRLAEKKGDVQSMMNLGYLYGYGHLGEPDYELSFKQFVKAMALGTHPEAIYKVGDAYARAQVVEKDLKTAYKLYKKCYENCGDLIGIKAQAAFRLAELIIDKDNAAWDIPYNPVMALYLYQVAELGMRIQVVNDAPWYAERLKQAMAGQDRARALMDEMGVELLKWERLNLL